MTRAAIIGAGVGGLSAAISLLQAGLDVDVYDQGQALHEIGAGIILAPNAVRLLDRLGLGAQIRSRACAATAHLFVRWADATPIIREEYGPGFVARFGSPSLSIHRGELVGILARRNAVMFHLPDGPGQRARDARIGSPAGGDPWRNNAWVYAYDPVAAAGAASI